MSLPDDVLKGIELALTEEEIFELLFQYPDAQEVIQRDQQRLQLEPLTTHDHWHSLEGTTSIPEDVLDKIEPVFTEEEISELLNQFPDAQDIVQREQQYQHFQPSTLTIADQSLGSTVINNVPEDRVNKDQDGEENFVLPRILDEIKMNEKQPLIKPMLIFQHPPGLQTIPRDPFDPWIAFRRPHQKCCWMVGSYYAFCDHYHSYLLKKSTGVKRKGKAPHSSYCPVRIGHWPPVMAALPGVLHNTADCDFVAHSQQETSPNDCCHVAGKISYCEAYDSYLQEKNAGKRKLGKPPHDLACRIRRGFLGQGGGELNEKVA